MAAQEVLEGEEPEPFNQSSLERVAYEAYATHLGWRGLSGERMPEWNEVDEVRGDIKAAWHAVVVAVNRAIIGEGEGGHNAD